MLTSSTTIATQLACALLKEIQSAQPDWERVKDIMAQLESTALCMADIAQSDVGKIMQRVKYLGNAPVEIRQYARKLVGKWKAAVRKELLSQEEEGRMDRVQDRVQGRVQDQIQEEKHPMTILTEKPFVFYSGAAERDGSTCKFSNFFACPNGVEVDGRIYPSSEHAYQGTVKFPTESSARFAMGGDLASFDGMSCFYPPANTPGKKPKDTAPGKTQFWSKKSMVGIVAKLAQGHPAKAGLQPLPKKDMELKRALFLPILMSKYSRDPELKAALLATGDRYLLEFCRGAKMREAKGMEPERWGGLAEELEGGASWRIYGDNMMGKLLMQVRDALQK